jgi:hypothetical protein
MLFLKIGENQWSQLSSFLDFLSFLPVVVRGVNGEDIYTKVIDKDQLIVAMLNERV